jgi:prepilin-type N-terminal cleavage/methylation domain-containing protein
MKKCLLKQNAGFTLIELAIAIVLAAIVVIMILPYFQSGITNSHRPAQWLQDAMAIQRVMENINGAYGKSLKDTAALNTLSTAIGTVGSSFNNQFGTYTVLENGFITFSSGNEVASVTPTRILKVTIRSTTTPGNQLTQLYTVQVP